jgi:hypothetical protein
MSEDGDSEGEAGPSREADHLSEPEAGAARRNMLAAARPQAKHPGPQARPRAPLRQGR